MWVIVGLVAGRMAGLVMKDGGYGLKGDLIIGLVGSIVGSWLFSTLGFWPGGGLVALVVGAFIGAAIAIVTQRTLWYGYA